MIEFCGFDLIDLFYVKNVINELDPTLAILEKEHEEVGLDQQILM